MKRPYLLLPLLAFVVSGCSSLFYYPTNRKHFEPKTFRFEYTEITFPSQDGTLLTGWYFPAQGDRKLNRTIVQFHGNGENISTHFLSLAWVTHQGYNLFTFDYRGYGRSAGEPSPSGVQKDALAAIEMALHYPQGHTPEKIILHGQSLGGAVLLGALKELKNREKIEAVIVEGAFSSYRSIARTKLAESPWTWLFQPFAIFVSDATSGRDFIPKIAPIPLLVIHGEKDRIIPPAQGKKIYETALEPKRLWTIPGGGHIDTFHIQNGEHRQTYLDFLQSVARL